ncbi:hypothetical protein D4764_20G0008160 [Takifugu flavidus]|uniref:Uncharacterized protein n=1 Tax=Takifugu flavidus TaxID=433684 RepID=A0A5C6NH33_9TELE|nr:hypothetical protein D4764_20G0008160 [Takifugu flavidus]
MGCCFSGESTTDECSESVCLPDSQSYGGQSKVTVELKQSTAAVTQHASLDEEVTGDSSKKETEVFGNPDIVSNLNTEKKPDQHTIVNPEPGVTRGVRPSLESHPCVALPRLSTGENNTPDGSKLSKPVQSTLVGPPSVAVMVNEASGDQKRPTTLVRYQHLLLDQKLVHYQHLLLNQTLVYYQHFLLDQTLVHYQHLLLNQTLVHYQHFLLDQTLVHYQHLLLNQTLVHYQHFLLDQTLVHYQHFLLDQTLVHYQHFLLDQTLVHYQHLLLNQTLVHYQHLLLNQTLVHYQHFLLDQTLVHYQHLLLNQTLVHYQHFLLDQTPAHRILMSGPRHKMSETS